MPNALGLTSGLKELRPSFVGRVVALARTIRGRIAVGFLLTGVITAGLGGFAAYTVHEAGKRVGRAGEEASRAITFAQTYAAEFAAMRDMFARRRVAPDRAEQAALDEALSRVRASLLHGLTEPSKETAAAPTRDALADIHRAITLWDADRAAVVAGAGPETSASMDARAAAVVRSMAALQDAATSQGRLETDRVGAIADRYALLTLASTGAALLASGFAAWLLARRIIGPVAAASALAEKIASGQLDMAVPDLGDDELGRLLSSMQLMRSNIRSIMEREVTLRRSAQTRLVDALESSHDGIIVVDADLRIALANGQAADFLGATPAMLAPGTPVLHLTNAARSSRQLLLDLIGLEGAAEESLLADGRWLRISRSSTREGGFIALCSDISVQKDQEVKLKATNLRLDAALENMSQGLCLYGSDFTLLVVNRRFCEIFGLEPEAIAAGMTLATVVAVLARAGHFPGRSADAVVEEEGQLFQDREPAMRFLRIADDRIVGVAVQALSDGGWLATYEDVTERRHAEERIAFMARHDALTELPNRVLFAERVDQAVLHARDGRQCAVLCLDLDHFKHVNDTLGHPVGDELLRVVSDHLRACVRDVDTVARLGGDEFAVVQPGIEDPQQAVILANRIIDRLSVPFILSGGHRVSIGVSIGISLAPDDGKDHGKLLKNADVALYRAKEDGRGTWRFFEADMDSRLQARREMELDLRRAIDGDQFELYYQPQFDLRIDRIVGFEALLRWRHPFKGLVPPGDFIPLAEEIGLIREIGAWVVRTACVEAMRWSAPLRVAVNVSPVQLRFADFSAIVAEALSLSGLDPNRLELEITESVMLSSSPAALDVLHQARDLGVQVSIDDFGTGYSSLTSLRSFPFNKIKIDRSFVMDLSANADSQAVIRAVIVLGAGLGIRTTAEGVETAEQMARLRVEGCSEVQGYLISPPKPASDIPVLLDRWNAGARRGLVAAVA